MLPHSTPPAIATTFVRKLYRILDHESPHIISWDGDGEAFSIHDEDSLEQDVLPRYFRCHLVVFRQQLMEHGFQREVVRRDEISGGGKGLPLSGEKYRHECFQRGHPHKLNRIIRVREGRRRRNKKAKKDPEGEVSLGKHTRLLLLASSPPIDPIPAMTTTIAKTAPSSSAGSVSVISTAPLIRPNHSAMNQSSSENGDSSLETCTVPDCANRSVMKESHDEETRRHALVQRTLQGATPIAITSSPQPGSPAHHVCGKRHDRSADSPVNAQRQRCAKIIAALEESGTATFANDYDNIPPVKSIARMVMFPWEMADSPAWDVYQRPRELFNSDGAPESSAEVPSNVLDTMLDCFGNSRSSRK